MNDRDRFVKCLLGERIDRPPYWVFWGPWAATWERWRREGMPESIHDWQDIPRHFGGETPPRIMPINCGPCPAFPREVIEETDDYVTFTDSWGIHRKDLKHGMSMPQFVRFPIKSRRDWEKYKEERLNPDDPRRLEGPWRERVKEWRTKGYPIQMGDYPDVGCFGTLRWLLGDEECLMAFYDDPKLVHEIMDHMTSIWITVYEKILREFTPDYSMFWEDMCGRQGPLISPKHFEEFMAPNYRRVTKVLAAHGVPIVGVDTDGMPDLLLGPMIRAGVNFNFPFEVAAGCDVNEFQKKYPTLGMMGGIDKRVLAKGHKEIDAEIARIAPAVRRGRYIPELDHTVPDDVSWDNFCHYQKRRKEMLGMA